MFALPVCAMDVCLDMHQQHAVFMFSLDVGQHLEKMCIQLGCAHELAFFPRFGWWIKKNEIWQTSIFCAKNSWLVGSQIHV